MSKNDTTTNLQELKDLVVKFRKDRDWDKHFTPKNVATSIAIEAAELLEHFQWDLLLKEDKEAIAKELADILIFSFHFATLYDIDISTEFRNKLLAAAKKYPAEQYKDSTNDLENYHNAKRKYRQKKI